jgi:transposase
MPRLPKIDRSNFLFYRNELGWTLEKIATRLGKSIRTVRRWLRIWESEGRLTKNKSTGRPRSCRNKKNLKRLKRHMLGTSPHSVREVARRKPEFGSKSTIQRALRQDLELLPYKKKKRTPLTEAHRAHRLLMAEHHILNDLDVKDVVFTDEKRFSFIHVPRGNEFVWTDDPHDDRRFVEVPKYQRNFVEVWAGITYYGQTKLYFIERPNVNRTKLKFTADRFVEEILIDALLEIDDIFLEHGVEKWIFQQDGDSKHTASVVQKYLQANTPKFVRKDQWPANSPDFNLIENLWDIAVRSLKRKRPKSLDGFRKAVQETWESIPLDVVQSLFNSWQDRMTAAMLVNGGHTKY